MSAGSRTASSTTASPPLQAGFPYGPKRTTWKTLGQEIARGLSVAHELSGLGSTRVVRFSASTGRRIDEPDDMATGPQDAEVSRRIEPLGKAGAVDDGSGGAAGNVGATIPALPRAV